MILKFKGADRMRDPLDRIALAVRPIVHRIDAPCVAGSMMMRVHDSIEDRISQVEIGGTHINLGSQRFGSVRKFPLFHASKEIEIVVDGTVTKWTVSTRLGQGASILSHLLAIEIAYERSALSDQLTSPFMQLTKIVGSIKEFVPVKAEPVNVGLD